MAEAVTGVTPFARAWMHIGIVQVGGEKMAKSAGNLVLVGDVVERYPPAVLRLLLIDRPWAQPWDFEPVGLDRAADRLERLYAAAARGTDGIAVGEQRRHGRAVGEPGRAGGPGRRRDGRRGGGPAGAVGARPELSRPAASCRKATFIPERGFPGESVQWSGGAARTPATAAPGIAAPDARPASTGRSGPLPRCVLRGLRRLGHRHTARGAGAGDPGQRGVAGDDLGAGGADAAPGGSAGPPRGARAGSPS